MANPALFESIKEKMTGAELRSLFVPEWGATIYFKPTSPHETAIARVGIDVENDPLSYYQVKLVNLKALDETGKRIFTNDQAKEMKDWPCQATFTRLAQEMNKTVTIEDAKEDFIDRPS
jgi:hypothetical protein